VVGNRTRVKVIKNKLAPPFQEAEFDIRWGTGVDRNGELIDLCVENGILKKAGAFLSFNGENIGQGREKAREHLLKTPALKDKLSSSVADLRTPERTPNGASDDNAAA
jgi:recombination protein RecA